MAEAYNSYQRRVEFSKGKQKEFIDLAIRNLSWSVDKLARELGVHPRTLRDWRREKFNIALPSFEKICGLAKLSKPQDIKVKEPFWYVYLGAMDGWKAVIAKYGKIPKNEKYRKERWLIWWNTKGQYNPNQFFVPRPVSFPKKSKLLAEFVGILLGDGSISKKSIAITLHKDDDKQYINYVAQICEKLFAVKPTLFYSKKDAVCDVIINRNRLINYLEKLGLHTGNKVKNQVGVPDWISKNKNFSKACLRGLLDTDGCFYVDKHRYKSKLYQNAGISFTNRSLPILDFFKAKLTELGFNPTQSYKFNILLRRENEIARYFREIGSSNEKNLIKYTRYLSIKGEVPKWS